MRMERRKQLGDEEDSSLTKVTKGVEVVSSQSRLKRSRDEQY